MLLRRVMGHVKAQNWTAVALDFVIVVVGVFIGIQVSNWNEARKDEGLARAAVENLKKEFDAIYAEAKFRSDFHLERVALLQELILCLDNSCDGVQLKLVVPTTVATSNSFFTVPPRSSTYIELINSGNINLLADDNLRLALFRYDTTLANASTALGRINDFASLYDKAMKRHTRLDSSKFMELDIDVWDWESNDFTIHDALPPIGEFDWEAMQQDAEFRRAADELLRMQIYYAGNHAAVLNECDELIGLLEAY